VNHMAFVNLMHCVTLLFWSSLNEKEFVSNNVGHHLSFKCIENMLQISIQTFYLEKRLQSGSYLNIDSIDKAFQLKVNKL